MNADYTTKIVQSSRELSVKERIALKDIRDATSLDDAVQPGDTLLIAPEEFVELAIHNEAAKGDKDYTKYVIIDKAGNKYYTGSKTFFRNFIDIWDEMKNEAPDEEFQISVYKIPSKNFAGKHFITCSIV